MVDRWDYRIVDAETQSHLLGWNLESPLGDSNSSPVRFTGWILPIVGRATIIVRANGILLYRGATDTTRTDVMQRLSETESIVPGVPDCGFDFIIEEISDTYEIDLEFDGNEFRFLRIWKDGRGQFAIEGNENYLFLGGDTNYSGAQFTGSLTLPLRSELGWNAHFKNIALWKKQHSFTSCFLVAPSKEEIFPDYYPESMSDARAISRFLRVFRNESIIYPIESLRKLRNFTYDRTDTHWTDAGAVVAVKEVLSYWNMQDAITQLLPREFVLRGSHGDLGSKLNPRRMDYQLAFKENISTFIAFNNNVSNNGNLRIYVNEAAPMKGSCLIFGDSFGFNMGPALSCAFKRVVFIYKPAAYDDELIKLEKPTHVLFQINQRFLIGQPAYSKSIFEMAADKINAMPDTNKKIIINELMSGLNGNFGNLCSKMLGYVKL